jgi:hypothetical protein
MLQRTTPLLAELHAHTRWSCAKDEASILTHLRSRRPVYLMHLRETALPMAA